MKKTITGRTMPVTMNEFSVTILDLNRPRCRQVHDRLILPAFSAREVRKRRKSIMADGRLTPGRWRLGKIRRVRRASV